MSRRFNAALALAVIALLPGWARAEDHGPGWMAFSASPNNLVSVQRGARDFMNYCSGCHSLQYQRYQRMATDLHIPDQLLKQDLMFNPDAKPGDTMVSAMPDQQAATWFGKAPPDLSLEAQVRGADWIYNYLQHFYLDPARPTGANNPQLPNAAMPDVLWSLQGWQKLVGKGDQAHFESVSQGRMTPEQYRDFVADLVNFLDYVASPERAQRLSVGFKTMIFLVILTGLLYLLNREYWRKIH
ncbi:MAG: cytochrome c1 [Gammaproteobacteria bacterium]|nr:cytochrome c1 [Gammaproteobacteria bacterium]